MVVANQLPAARSVYDYPVVIPGQELTEEQKKQKQVAQIAGIVTAVAAAKAALTEATVLQVVSLLKATDLTNEAAVELFAKQAARLVSTAIKHSQRVTWSGVKQRALVAGVSFPPTPPKKLPSDLQKTRATPLEQAYTRVAKEYRKYKEKTPDDPTIKQLVSELEAQNLTPIPRAESISSDVVTETVTNEQDWQKTFQKAVEESRKAESRAYAETQSEAVLETLEKSSSSKAWEEYGKLNTANETTVSQPSYGDRVDEAANKFFRLTESEVQRVIETYARHKAEELTERMIQQDIQSASRNTAQAAMRKLPKTVTGFRRIVHPELSKSGQSCGLCVVASTHKYSRGDLLPIHTGCNCEVAEIYEIDGYEFDPGNQINMEDLDVFYKEAGWSTHGWKLKRQRYEIQDHPEFGPVLVNAKPRKGETVEPVEFEKKES